MAPGSNWRYNPTPKQKEMFQEWKSFCIGLLVTSREGFNVKSIAGKLDEFVGERMPLYDMGIPSINHFLYEMADSVEIRSLPGGPAGIMYYVFIRDHAIPENQQHVREMVLVQQKDKSCKSKSGRIIRPTKKQTNYVAIQEFLSATSNAYYNRNSAPSNRPVLVPTAPYSNRNAGTSNAGRNFGGGYKGSSSSFNKGQPSNRFKSTAPSYPARKPDMFVTKSYTDWTVHKSSNVSTPSVQTTKEPSYTAPARSRYIPGLVDDDDDDDSNFSDLEYNGFDLVSVKSSVNKGNPKTAQNLVTPISKPLVTPVVSSASVIEPQPTSYKKPEFSRLTLASWETTYAPAVNLVSAKSSENKTAQNLVTSISKPVVSSASVIEPQPTSYKKPEPEFSRLTLASWETTPTTPVVDLVSAKSSVNKENPKTAQNLVTPISKPVVTPVVSSASVIEPKPACKVPMKTNATVDLHPKIDENQSVIDLHPNIGYKLDRRNDLAKNFSGLRMVYQLPAIIFPAFFQGGTKECVSLKAFLKTTNQSLNL